VDVSDSVVGFLGSVCAGQTLPAVFTYSAPVGPYPTCGDYVAENVASYVTLDTGATGSSSWSVAVQVPCEGGGGGGCTLTIGYWKTHAGFGPQDDVVTELLPIWLGTPGGASSVQVTDAAQAVDILAMDLGDPSNGITKLYAQMLAAKLNIASGADPAVADAIAAADAFLAEHSWEDWASLTSEDQQMVLGWMTTFDEFNNGLAGPEHCDDTGALAPEAFVEEPLTEAACAAGGPAPCGGLYR
jgi:hypothetical protein